MIKLAFYAILLAVSALQAQDLAPQGRASRVPALPIRSGDGCIVVRASAKNVAARAPVLSFVQKVREDFSRTTGMTLKPQNGVLEVRLGAESGTNTAVNLSRVVDPAGGLLEIISLPDPEHSDLDKFRRAICLAFLRLWTVDESVALGTDAVDVPMWYIDGVLRASDYSTRAHDNDRVLELWGSAKLPSATGLFAASNRVAKIEPAVGAVVASWTLDRKHGRSGLECILARAASGKEWATPFVAGLVTGTNDLAVADRLLDMRLYAARRAVRQPGLTTAQMLKRFREDLYLYPGTFGKNLGRGISFQEAVRSAGEPDIRFAAYRQAYRIRLASVGRDERMAAMCKAYEEFLLSLSKGEKAGKLSAQLLKADNMRLQLEEACR